MLLFVTAKTGSKKDSIERLDDTHVLIAVREPPTEGRANIAIAKALARHLRIPLARITLRSGASSRRKVFEIGATSMNSGAQSD